MSEVSSAVSASSVSWSAWTPRTTRAAADSAALVSMRTRMVRASAGAAVNGHRGGSVHSHTGVAGDVDQQRLRLLSRVVGDAHVRDVEIATDVFALVSGTELTPPETTTSQG